MTPHKETLNLSNSRFRYAINWVENFEAHYHRFLGEGMTILDVGSGRNPIIPVAGRPLNCHYIGIDISQDELNRAPDGSYDEMNARDLADHDPALVNRVDLAICRQVLEHIGQVPKAIGNVHSYLKPGGHFVALLSGKNSHFAIINRVIPEVIGVTAMKYLLKRPPDTVFRAHYCSCTYSELSTILASWTYAEVIPLFRGAVYLSFFPPLAALYLKYEDWIARTGKKDFATHYIIVAKS
jgi:SAM-dependent methyltransferase